MRSDRAAAGLGGAALMVAIAFAPGSLSMREIVFLALAAVILVGAFAPGMPLVHRLPVVGAPRVSVALSFEPLQEGGSQDLAVSHVSGLAAEPRVLRVGFINKGPRRVQGALINVLVDGRVEIAASDHLGDTSIEQGREMPPTEVDDRPMRFWANKDVTLWVGGTLLNYRLSFPDVLALGDEFLIRVQYDADDLYGGERVCERRVRVVDVGQSR